MATRQVTGRNEYGIWAELDRLDEGAWGRNEYGLTLAVPYYLTVADMDLSGFQMAAGRAHTLAVAAAPVHKGDIAARQASAFEVAAASLAQHDGGSLKSGRHHEFGLEIG